MGKCVVYAVAAVAAAVDDATAAGIERLNTFRIDRRLTMLMMMLVMVWR